MARGGSSAEASLVDPILTEDYWVDRGLIQYQVETQGTHEQVISNAAIETAQMASGGSSAEVTQDFPSLFETQGSHEQVIVNAAIETAQMASGGSSVEVSPDFPSLFQTQGSHEQDINLLLASICYSPEEDFSSLFETPGSHEQVIGNAAIETAQMASGGSSAEASLDDPNLFEDYLVDPEFYHCQVETQGSHEQVIGNAAIETALMVSGGSSAETSLVDPGLIQYQVETQGSHEQVIVNAAIEPAQIDHNETMNPDVEVLASPPPKKRRKRSKVWDCFTADRDRDGKDCVVCNKCKKSYARSTKKETSNMIRHMKICLGRGEDKPAEMRCIKTPVFSDKEIAADQEWNHLIQARTIIEHGHPWNTLSGNLVNNLPDMKTLKANILRVYEEGKKELCRSLGNLSCRLNLTMNLLKHDDKNIYCYLTLHFIDENWELGKKVLAFKKIAVWEKTWNQFFAFQDMLLDWKINKNVFSLTAQNTEENDQMIEDVKRWLDNRKALPFGGKVLRVGCFAHILDLLVEDGFEEAKEVFNKIMDCIFYVRNTRDRRDMFQTAVKSSKLEVTIEDIPQTCTLSIQLLEKLLSLRDAFNLLMVIDHKFSLNPLIEEWDDTNTICGCLKVLNEAVQWFSGSRGLTTNLLFLQACNLYETLCDWNKSSNPKVAVMSSKMKMKFDVYWHNNNLVFAIAIVLDPRFKFEIVEHWYKKIYSEDPEKHCARVHDSLKEFYCVYAVGYNDSTSSAILFGDASSSKTYDTSNMLAMLGMPCTRSHGADHDKSQKSELERYLEEPKHCFVKEFDVLDWWRVNTSNFPTLAKLAREFLAIPMSAACSNPTFNADIMKIDLVSMDPEILEALICARDWLQKPEKKKILKQGFT